MITYKQFNFINEIETLIFTFFFNFLILEYFLNAMELPNILEFLSVSFLKGKNILFHPGGLTMDSKYFNI